MGFGVPVVATSIAVEGMGIVDGKEGLVADDPQAFAAAVVELYQSESLWNRISHNGLRKTQKLYSMEAARQQFIRIFSNLSKREIDALNGCAQGARPLPSEKQPPLSQPVGKEV